MIGAMKCMDKNGNLVMLTGHSGPPTTGAIPDHPNPGGQGKSLGGNNYNIKKVKGSNRPGNCAAPKLAHEARLRRLTPLAMTESWHGRSPPSGAPFTHGGHVESCDTCKRLLPAMLCPQKKTDSK
jgi:hypothetical protein